MGSDFNAYKLPLPVLRGYLGPSTITEFESPREDGSYHRAWRCGCIAQYRKSSHQTAVWRPCATHRANPARFGEEVATAPDTRALGELGRRLGPSFCIIDSSLDVLCKSPGANVEHLMERVRGQVERAVAKGEAAVIPLEDTVLRIVPLTGVPMRAFAVVAEGQRGSSALNSAAVRFGLTRREMDVLRLLARNHGSAEIARELCIAESTVADHLKNLFRKTGSSRRTELLTKLFLT
jgi:DNA-binding CsgD family transcriptional regulator